jgi:hydrogenase expression/formation protein HypE
LSDATQIEEMNDPTILLSHGGGGALTEQLLATHLFPHLAALHADRHGDAVILPLGDSRIAFTTDSFVVRPWRFPGGDIGRLAVCGTVNDLAVAGAQPRYLSLALILEEGFASDDLAAVARSIQTAAEEADVEIVTGDTKVVERGHGDGIYINTAGIGAVPSEGELPRLACARPGDAVILSGTLGDHGLAVMQAREGFGIAGALESDVAPVSGLVEALRSAGVAPHVLKDPTRGGVAMALNEIAEQSEVHVRIEEEAVRVKPAVARLADLLGLDVLEAANEGKILVVCAAEEAETALSALREHPLGREAARIGAVVGAHEPLVTVATRAGGERILIKPAGESLPRIC